MARPVALIEKPNDQMFRGSGIDRHDVLETPYKRRQLSETRVRTARLIRIWAILEMEGE